MLHFAHRVERIGDGGVNTASADDGVGQIVLRSEQIVAASTDQRGVAVPADECVIPAAGHQFRGVVVRAEQIVARTGDQRFDVAVEINVFTARPVVLGRIALL